MLIHKPIPSLVNCGIAQNLLQRHKARIQALHIINLNYTIQKINSSGPYPLCCHADQPNEMENEIQ